MEGIKLLLKLVLLFILYYWAAMHLLLWLPGGKPPDSDKCHLSVSSQTSVREQN